MANLSSEKNLYHPIRKDLKYSVMCPVCGKKQKIGIEVHELSEITDFPFTHIHIHGTPLHALVVYIDKHFNVRGFEGCNSIGVAKGGEVLKAITKKWSNPF